MGVSLPTIALSIRQPWVHLILREGKDIENRSWNTKFRGKILLHASKGMARYEYDHCFDVSQLALRKRHEGRVYAPPAYEAIERGGIVGTVEIVDCVTHSDSPWFFGDYGFVLRNPQPLPFFPFKGQLGFFHCKYGN